ncbi:MAG: bifunctional enoyl-CoA hydratase/phosphate acetyltransferase [Fusobacteriaceae bacterium]
MSFFNSLLDIVKKKNHNKILVVACADDKEVLQSVEAARKLDVISCILIGDEKKICEISESLGIDTKNYQIINILDQIECCKKAVSLIKEKKADILMKGFVDTFVILREVLNSECGLRISGKQMSHVVLFNSPSYHKTILVTDPAMNMSPTLEEKKKLIENGVQVMQSLGVKIPKVAVLCALEKVNQKMIATVEASELQKMNQDGIIKNCIVSGPLAFDLAISKEAVNHKKVSDPVAGDADILLVPNIESGNILYKSFIYFAKVEAAAVIVGASAPFVLTSRSDSEITKLNSILLAVAIS